MSRDRAARPEAKPLRLFVAVEIPEAVKDAIEEAFAPWREAVPAGAMGASRELARHTEVPRADVATAGGLGAGAGGGGRERTSCPVPYAC